MVQGNKNIGFSTYVGNNVIIKDEAGPILGTDAASPLAETTVTNLAAFDYVPWGEDNLEPIRLAQEIADCGILNSIIESQSRLSLGKGVLWAYTTFDKNGSLVIDNIPALPELDEFMEENNHVFHELALMQDLIGFKHGAIRFVLNKARNKIALFQRDDITELRYQKMNDLGIVENAYLCAEWDKVPSINDKRVLTVPLLNPNGPLADLRDRVDGGKDVTFMTTYKNPAWRRKYYPCGDWVANRHWMKISKQIPKMKEAMFNHNFRPRYLVTIYERFWENRFSEDASGKAWEDYTDSERDTARQKVYDDIDKHLAGVDNHGKAIFVDGYFDSITGKAYSEIEIKAIEDQIKEGDMLPDSAAANSEIAFGMKYNPAIIGASLPSGPYTNSQGGSNVRESVTVQILIHEPERQMICNWYNLVKKFNGWDTTYKRDGFSLTPVIPTTILTTLDTGKGTSQGVNGGQPAQPGNSSPANPPA